ncbi:TPA: hypothetical protein U2M35_002114 [Providencia rettgeri]|nr:hypothetical protein [Providencia rettgeri]
MGKQFYNELDGQEQLEYAMVYDILKTIEKNGEVLQEKDTFNYLIKKNGYGKLPEMPQIKYHSDMKVPIVVAESLLIRISYMLKNDIKLPEGLIYYITQALDSVINDKLDLNKAFLFKTKFKRKSENYADVFKFVVNYIIMRISVLYTLGEDWDDIVISKNDKGLGFYEELAEELYLNYDFDDSVNDRNRAVFNFTAENIKNIVENNKLYNTIGFINSVFFPSGNCSYSENITKCRLYLKKSMNRGGKNYPLNKNDAKKRIEELDLIEEYLRMKPEELPGNKRYKAWADSRSG